MTRVLLVALALLVSLLVLGRLRRPASPPVARAAAVTPARPKARGVGAASPLAPDSTAAPGAPTPAITGIRTPAIDMSDVYAMGGEVLFAPTPSELVARVTAAACQGIRGRGYRIVRHWPDPRGVPLTVAVASQDPVPGLDAALRAALAAWEDVVRDIRFNIVNDTSTAQIVVHTRPQSVGDRAGETLVQWSRDAGIVSAVITVSRAGPDGKLLTPPALLAVMTHEVGHALGLGHSPDSADVMFPAAHLGRLTQRDRATLTLLYELPLGYLREPPSR